MKCVFFFFFFAAVLFAFSRSEVQRWEQSICPFRRRFDVTILTEFRLSDGESESEDQVDIVFLHQIHAALISNLSELGCTSRP
jgi:hypothetical protein